MIRIGGADCMGQVQELIPQSFGVPVSRLQVGRLEIEGQECTIPVFWNRSSVERWERIDNDVPATSVRRSGGCFHMIARDDETRWQRWWRFTVVAWRHRKCGGGS